MPSANHQRSSGHILILVFLVAELSTATRGDAYARVGLMEKADKDYGKATELP